MDVRLHLFEPFLVDNAEPLFLIHHDQPEPLKLHRLGEERMGADNNVDCPGSHLLSYRLGFVRGHQPRQTANPDRKPLKPLNETVIMLTREEGRWTDERDLHPRHRGDKSRAQGNLGLAESNIPHDQPVHRFPGREIANNVADRAVLIVGFLIGEAVDELGVNPGFHINNIGLA